MNPFEFALAMVALVLFFRLIKTGMAHRSTTPRGDDAINAELRERLSQVEERVRVLERIVTDERYDLKRQIEDLGA